MKKETVATLIPTSFGETFIVTCAAGVASRSLRASSRPFLGMMAPSILATEMRRSTSARRWPSVATLRRAPSAVGTQKAARAVQTRVVGGPRKHVFVDHPAQRAGAVLKPAPLPRLLPERQRREVLRTEAPDLEPRPPSAPPAPTRLCRLER